MKGSILWIGQCTSQWYAHHSQNSFHLSILSLSTRDSCVGMFLGLLWSSLQFNIQIYKHRWPVHNFSSHMGQQLCLGNRGLTSHFRITSRTLWPSCRILCNVGRTSGRGGQVVDGGDSWEPQPAMCWLGIGKRYTCTLPNLSKILDVSEEKTDGQIDHLQFGGWGLEAKLNFVSLWHQDPSRCTDLMDSLPSMQCFCLKRICCQPSQVCSMGPFSDKRGSCYKMDARCLTLIFSSNIWKQNDRAISH